MNPDIIVVGQITVDDTVPVSPGRWQRELGGNAFYSAAGARLWCESSKVGMVARVPRDLPLDPYSLLESAGISSAGLIACEEEALVEWILYEEDGNRQSMPRNPQLRDPAADLNTLYRRYLDHIKKISARADEIPSSWLPAPCVHLAPQVQERHQASCTYLQGKTAFISVDPSPHYSRSASASELAAMLPSVSALMPSQAEAQALSNACGSWEDAVRSLRITFPEVVLKCGAAGCIVGIERGLYRLPPAQATPVDLTGAGDSFSAAYATNRAAGCDAMEAAMRATVTAAMVIETSGTKSALALRPEDAEVRLAEYKRTSAALVEEIQ